MKRLQETMKGRPPEDFTAAYIRIQRWFFAYPEKEFSFNDICKGTDTAKTTGKKVITELENMQIIKRTVTGQLWRLQANRESPAFRRMKIVNNLDMLYATNVIDFILKNYPQARTIVLFGSFRKGDDISPSDIDIAVEIPGTTQLRVEQAGVIDRFGYRENVKVSLHIFARNTVDPNVFANIANGIVIYGFLEVKP
jgi:predicted nucleotidyltransferase